MRVFILLYADDLLITGDDKNRIAALKEALHKDFEMSDLGEAQFYLGAKIQRSEDGILLTQTQYIKKLHKFRIQSCNPSLLPMDSTLQL